MYTSAVKSRAQQTISAKTTLFGRANFEKNHQANSIFTLHPTIGNKAVDRVLEADPGEVHKDLANIETVHFGHDFSRVPAHPKKSLKIQSKLKINTPGDIYEEEAERIANEVIETPANSVLNLPARPIQRFEGQSNPQVDVSSTSVERVLASPGRPLEPVFRRDMEQRLGHDFSKVRVHTDVIAEQSALDLNAHAYTVGNNIVFGAGKFAPLTHDGRRLIAHELTHVVQQSFISDAGRVGPTHGTPVAQRQTAPASQGPIQQTPARQTPAPQAPASKAATQLEIDTYTNVVAAQNELEQLIADFKTGKSGFDKEHMEEIKRKLERAFHYLREAWRKQVTVEDYPGLGAAMASYSRARKKVGEYVAFLPQGPVREDALFWLESLDWLEIRIAPPKLPLAPPQAVTDLSQDMGRQIDQWKESCIHGIQDFVDGELADRIEALSQGNWESFFKILTGNTIWAAVAFLPVGGPAFAVSMLGIGIATAPTVPQKGSSKNQLKEIKDQLETYIENIHKQLNSKLSKSADTLLRHHPGVPRQDALKLFLEASFKPDMIQHDQPMINTTAVRRMMHDVAKFSLKLNTEISNTHSTTHTEVAWLTPPDYGAKRLAVVEATPSPYDVRWGVKFLRWVPEENEAIALATGAAQPGGIGWHLFEMIAQSSDPSYLLWLQQHGWKPEDGFGLDWLKRK
jgi:hypothetical protein